MVRYPQIEQVVARAREAIRVRGYSPRTEKTYVRWIERFFLFSGRPHPDAVQARHAEAFLAHLASDRHLAAKSRNLAASALAFLFREVLEREGMERVKRAKGPKHVPVVLSRREVEAVLDALGGVYRIVCALMYGTGMRLNESLGIRLKDVDFELGQITVRDGKGGRDRYAILPERLQPLLQRQIRRVLRVHKADLERGSGWAPLPGALWVKTPGAGWEPRWQFLFPAKRLTSDPLTGRRGRYHLHGSAVQRAVKVGVRDAGVLKAATCHTLRHSFASQLLRDGYDIRQVKELLGHKDIRTTMIYLHAVEQTGLGIRSPLDRSRFGGGRLEESEDDVPTGDPLAREIKDLHGED